MIASRIALLKQSSCLRGGLEKQTLGIIHSLLERGLEVDLLCQSPCDWPKLAGLRVLAISSKKSLSYLSLRHYDRALKHHFQHHRYERVLGLERHHFQTHYRAGSGVHKYFLQQRAGHGSYLREILLNLNPFHRLVLQLEAKTFGANGARRIYTNSQMVASQITDAYQTNSSRLHVIRNGVAWSSMQTAFDTSLTQSRLDGLDERERYLCFIGHGYERKGLKTALEALAQARGNFHLLVIGKEKSLPTYKNICKKLDIENRVHFLDARYTPLQLYQVCESLVLPSQYDPCSNVILEALAMGLNVLASMRDGASELLAEGCGKKLCPDTPRVWADALEELWNNRASIPERQKIRASVQHLEWDQQLSKLVDDFTTT